MKNKTVELKQQYNTNVVCPKDTSSPSFKLAAWHDQQEAAADRLGLMHCYCYALGKKTKSLDSMNIKWSEFRKKDAKGQEASKVEVLMLGHAL